MNKPNIIFLIEDQMQQGILNQPDCIVPNMRKLMADGIEFDHAYTCNAICSPARASLLTGTLPHTHGMVDCTHTVPPYRAEYDYKLDTLTNALCEEGYGISYYGKWHIERSHDLSRFGIERYETEVYMPKHPATMIDRMVIKTPGYQDKTICGVFSEGEAQTDEHYVYDRSMEYMLECKKKGKTFCSFLSTNAPHDPYCVPKEIYDIYADKAVRLPENHYDSMQDKPVIYRRMREALGDLKRADFEKVMRCYYAYCTLVDIQIGRLIAFLKEHDLYDNTLIVLMSDHGDMMGAHGMMMKSVPCFEEIYHIPLIMKMPQQEKAGTTAGFYVGTPEIASTVLELAGCRKLKGKHIGESVVPWLKGEKTDKRHAFAEFFGQRFFYTQRIYWQDDMKYVFNAFDEDELYDLKNDPHELINVSKQADYQEIKRELCRQMWEIIKDTEDSTLADAEYYLMRFAPVGPGEKKQMGNYTLYNKTF